MNSLLIRTDQAEYFRFSTENAQMEFGETGLLLGQQVEVTYLLSQADPIPATTVRLLAEEISAENKLLINILHSMTLEEKVAQMFFVRCPAEYADQTVLKWQIGGFILFGIFPEKRQISCGKILPIISKMQKPLCSLARMKKAAR